MHPPLIVPPSIYCPYVPPSRSGDLVAINLVVGDGVEEVVVAGVQHGVDHAPGDAQHGRAAVLDLNIEGAVAGLGVLDLAGVASGDERGGAVEAGGEVLGSAGVLGGGHGHGLRQATEEEDLDL